MMTSNNALVPDPDKQDDLASQFWQWPILNVGLRMCGWDDHSRSLKPYSPETIKDERLISRGTYSRQVLLARESHCLLGKHG